MRLTGSRCRRRDTNWYEDKEQTRLFDFKGEPITKSKNIYAGFAKTGTVDTRRWAISGEGQGDVLLASRSGTVIADIHLLKKAVTKNEFTIRLDLYEGDEFRFVAEGDATHQRGIGYVASFDRTLQSPINRGILSLNILGITHLN